MFKEEFYIVILNLSLINPLLHGGTLKWHNSKLKEISMLKALNQSIMQCIRSPKLPSLGFRLFGVCCCGLTYIKIQSEFFSKQKFANFEIAFFKKSRQFYFKNRLVYSLAKIYTCLHMYSWCVWVFILIKYVKTKNIQRKWIMVLFSPYPI